LKRHPKLDKVELQMCDAQMKECNCPEIARKYGCSFGLSTHIRLLDGFAALPCRPGEIALDYIRVKPLRPAGDSATTTESGKGGGLLLHYLGDDQWVVIMPLSVHGCRRKTCRGGRPRAILRDFDLEGF
jgi:hypothetical protein